MSEKTIESNLKKTTLIVIFFSCVFTLSAQDTNPFESIGKKGKILTLSNGKYTEVHINDSLQRIGSVIVNMNTGMIYELLNIDTLYSEATLDPTIIGRWYSVDPLFAKFPDKSPYHFVGNNPIMNREIDGRDYGVSITKSENGNTITIKVIYYTDVKGSESYNSAVAATEFWNAQNGKFQYVVNESDGSQTVYDVIFDLSYKEEGYGDKAQLAALDDKIGNSYTVRADENVSGGGFGGTERGEFVDVAYSRKDTDTGPHEIGHTLNLGHFFEGLMKEIDKGGKITRESVVLTEYVQQIIDFSLGKGNMKSDTAPITKANTTFDNPQNLKTEGSVILNENDEK